MKTPPILNGGALHAQIGGALKVNAKVRGALAHKEGTHAQIGGAT